MISRGAPALVPVLAAFAALHFAATAERAPSVSATVALGGLGLALGGSGGAVVVAAAAGGVLGVAARVDEPANDAVLAAEVEGRVCGRWRRRAEIDSRTARFCPAWASQGGRRLARPPRLWISIPDERGIPEPGSTLRARGALTRFPGFANAEPRAPGPWRLRVKSTRLVDVVAPPRAGARFANALRGRIDAAIGAAERKRPVRGLGIALARGLLLGDDDELPEEIRRALRRCGLAHLLAVSGFNLTLVAALAAFAAGVRRSARSLAPPALVVALYLCAVGQEPSLLRAAVMAGAALALHGAGRAGSPLQALALAALTLAAVDPALASDPGLQLSCGATGGLLVGARRWSEAFEPLPRFLRIALAASVAAQVGALPASVASFGELAPLAPLVNLIALPWAALATVASLAWLLLALVSAPGAAAASGVLDLLAAPLGALDRLPPTLWLSTPVAGGALAGLALAVAVASVLEAMRRGRGRELFLALALLGLSPARSPGLDVEAAFLDVGQGDSALVRAGGTVVLVDGGGLLGRDVGTDVLRPALVRRGWTEIDAAVVSHPHRDHCAGLLELSHHLRIGEILVAPAALGDSCVTALGARTERGARAMTAGERWTREGLSLTVLSPEASERPSASENAESLVVRVEAGGRAILFAGDLGAAEERGLAAKDASALASDVLKVAHHGSAGSSTESFLAGVRPRLAIVSAGARNPFGHPARAALERLAAAGARLLRTDRDGEIALGWSRGGPLRIELPASPRGDPPASQVPPSD